jgi:cell fate regulator YaaT (PSP1 superfamily)
MGCGSCGTGGCGSGGGCSSGSCNRLNVYDWLVNIPLADAESACKVVEISFNQGSRKDYFRNNTLQLFEKGDLVTVEGVGGYDVGEVSLTGEMVRLQLKKKGIHEFDPEIKKVLRKANDRDLESFRQQKAREKDSLIRARAISRQLKLDMKMSQVEFQADGRKATFFYIADDRVDFRELIKIYAGEFKVKIEMRQIGARQEAAKVGGIGSCGRELCCSSWLGDFKSVNTTAARYQNLSINQTKLSGQCGRLKCCLNYELDTYLDALQQFPDHVDVLQVARGRAHLIKKDIFKNLMWYTLPDSSKQYPLSIERVLKIKSLNQQNIFPDELEPVDVTTGKAKEIEPAFVDVVGQISLRSLEKNERRKRQQQRPRGQEGPANRDVQGRNAGQPARSNRPPRDPNDAPRDPRHAPREQNQAGREPGNPRDQQRGPRDQNRPPRNPDSGPRDANRPPRDANRPPRDANRPPRDQNPSNGAPGSAPSANPPQGGNPSNQRGPRGPRTEGGHSPSADTGSKPTE